jgi:hypothetical protein
MDQATLDKANNISEQLQIAKHELELLNNQASSGFTCVPDDVWTAYKTAALQAIADKKTVLEAQFAAL